MISPEAQGAQATLEALRALLSELWAMLDAATTEAAHYDGFQDESPDRALYPNMVRFHLKKALQSHRLEAVEEDEHRLEHEVLPNNGLQLHYGPWDIRIRKAVQGTIPAPTSQTLKDFYEQPSLFGADVESQRLLLLWDTPGGVLDVSLACPRSGDGAPHWKVPVPHPAYVHASDQDARAAEDDFDLPITLRDASENDQ